MKVTSLLSEILGIQIYSYIFHGLFLPHLHSISLKYSSESKAAYLSNLIYCFAGAISSQQRGIQCADLTKSVSKGNVKGRSRSVIQSCGCDQEGRKLSRETGIKEVGFEVFPERCDRGALFIWKGIEFQRTGA